MTSIFKTKFLEAFPTKKDFDELLIVDYLIQNVDDDVDIEDLTNDGIMNNYWDSESEMQMIFDRVGELPDVEEWLEFYNDLCNTDWYNLV